MMRESPQPHDPTGLLRTLIYPIQFCKVPADEVNRIVRDVLPAAGPQVSRQDYLSAIRSGLNNDMPLASLIPQPHSEETIRRYLADIEACLKAASEP